MLSAAVLVALVAISSAQTIGFGGCPKKVTVQENFDVTKYMGTWYEIGSIPNTFQSGLSCVSAKYTLQDDGFVKVENAGVKTNGDLEDIEGQAKIMDASEPAKLGVRFSRVQPWGPYWVVDTDYDNYTFIWSCSSVGIAHAEFAWIMSRERTLDPEIVAALKQKGKDMGIAVDKIGVTSQENCP